MKAAIIQESTNTVVNVIELEANSIWPAPDGHFVRFDESAAIGMTWDGTQLIAPPPEPVIIVPPVITRRQFLIAGAVAGFFTMAEAATAAESGEVPASIMSIFAELSGPEQFAAQITWATMTTVSPDEALITAYAAANGLTQAQINAFFIGAATI